MKTRFQILIPVLLFSGMAFLDLWLQQGASVSQVQEATTYSLGNICGQVLTAIKLGLFWGGLSILLGKWSRVLILPLWVWVCWIETVEIFARIIYKMSLDGDWLMIVLASSSAEMKELTQVIGIGNLALGFLGFILMTIVGCRLLWCATRCRQTGWRRFIGGACLLPFVLWNVVFHSPATALHEVMFTYLPVDTLHNWALYADMGRTASAPGLPAEIRIEMADGKCPLGVFVIGESATRTHWHLYGYGRPTTPSMDEIRHELVVFTDATATAPTTGKALRYLLTDATLENPEKAYCTFPQRVQVAGGRSVLFSAQAKWGRWTGVEPLLFSGCERKVYLHESPMTGKGEEGPFDGDLLPLLDQELASSNCPDCIFLHLEGSHAPPACRYPSKRSIYPRYDGDIPPGVDERDTKRWGRVDFYDNSIVYTDCLLGEIIDRLKASQRASFLVYLSDHGETPNSEGWRDQSDPALWQVPLVVWFSSEYRRLYPQTVTHIDSLAHHPVRLDGFIPIFEKLLQMREGGVSAY